MVFRFNYSKDETKPLDVYSPPLGGAQLGGREALAPAHHLLLHCHQDVERISTQNSHCIEIIWNFAVVLNATGLNPVGEARWSFHWNSTSASRTLSGTGSYFYMHLICLKHPRPGQRVKNNLRDQDEIWKGEHHANPKYFGLALVCLALKLWFHYHHHLTGGINYASTQSFHFFYR